MNNDISGFGQLLMRMRKASGQWALALFAALALLVVLNFFIHPHHPHVDAENLPGFWAVFALGVAVVLGFVAKGILAVILDVPEDFYDE